MYWVLSGFPVNVQIDTALDVPVLTAVKGGEYGYSGNSALQLLLLLWQPSLSRDAFYIGNV